ncbi:MAG: class B sortase [Lachnospirales bacterium]
MKFFLEDEFDLEESPIKNTSYLEDEFDLERFHEKKDREFKDNRSKIKKREFKIDIFLYILTGIITAIVLVMYPIIKNATDKKETLLKENEVVESIDYKISEELNNYRVYNKEVVGIIKISGTNINYPVLQGKNNSFYLDHGMYRKSNLNGAIFMDTTNDLSMKDTNTILFGDINKENTMFSDLLKFKDEKFAETNKYIELETLEGIYIWEIFAFYEEGQNFFFLNTDFDNTKEIRVFIRNILNKSLYTKDVEVGEDEKILTLTTFMKNGMRYVLNGRLVEE